MWLRAAAWSHYREAARKNPTAVEHKGKSTGGRTEQASNIARGTPGSSVTCGIARSDSISCEMPSCSGAARLRGPWVAERPGVPRAPVFRGCADGDEGIRRARAANNRAAFARLLRIRCQAQSATDTQTKSLIYAVIARSAATTQSQAAYANRSSQHGDCFVAVPAPRNDGQKSWRPLFFNLRCAGC